MAALRRRLCRRQAPRALGKSSVRRRAALLTLRALSSELTGALPRARGQVVDINAFPGWSWSYRTPWALSYRKRLLKSTYELVLDVQRGADNSDEGRLVPRSGNFELIYNLS